MRNTILSVMTLAAVTVAPAITIAEPVKETKTDKTKVIENIKASIDYKTMTKDEVAANQIALNLKKIEEERKAAEAAQATKLAAARAPRPVAAVKPTSAELTALYNAAGARFGVNPALLAAVHMVESGQRGDTTIASSAGAQGPMQFMPGTFRAYAVDGDGDGVANIYDVHDAVFTAANYLAANGAASGNVVNALLRYNHSMTYVNYVLAVARDYGYSA